MSDDRWSSDDDRAPYIDRSRPGVRPAAQQPDRRGPPTPEEIAAFIQKEYGSEKPQRKKLVRPAGWDGPEPVTPPPHERGDAWEGERETFGDREGE